MVVNCETALELLSAKLDGELQEEDQKALDAHLSHCPHCQKIAQAYEDLDEGLLDMMEEPPAQLRAGVMAEIAKENVVPIPKKRWMFGSGTAVAAAIALVILAVGGDYLPGFGSATTTTETATVTTTAESRMVPESAIEEPTTMMVEAETALMPYESPAAVATPIEVRLVIYDDAENPFPVAEALAPTSEGLYFIDIQTAEQLMAEYAGVYEFEYTCPIENPTQDMVCVLEILP